MYVLYVYFYKRTNKRVSFIRKLSLYPFFFKIVDNIFEEFLPILTTLPAGYLLLVTYSHFLILIRVPRTYVRKFRKFSLQTSGPLNKNEDRFFCSSISLRLTRLRVWTTESRYLYPYLDVRKHFLIYHRPAILRIRLLKLSIYVYGTFKRVRI